MASGVSQNEAEKRRILLGLLDSIERGGQSQRGIATELGVALGLVNAYLKRCINKGLIKVGEIPARRYAYYLTPLGFAEKSRLTLEYLTSSFEFFRRAKADCSNLFQQAIAKGCRRVLFVGRSDLAEIAALCAQEHGVEIVGLVDEAAAGDSQFFGKPVFSSIANSQECDAVLITDLGATRNFVGEVIARVGRERVLVPNLLRHLLVTTESGDE